MNTTAKGTTAAVLLIVPVVAELVSEPLGDGTPFKITFAASQLVGWLLLAGVCRRSLPSSTLPRAAGIESVPGSCAASCLAEMVFAATYGVLEVVTGEPEASFVFFWLGLLLTTVGRFAPRFPAAPRGCGDGRRAACSAAAVLGFRLSRWDRTPSTTSSC